MLRLTLGSILAASLVFAAAASAGGWATAGMKPPPGGISAGDTWNADVTILQHGQTPLVGVKPTVTIRNDAGRSYTFPARPTKTAGVYQARITFPSGGTWRYEVNDGFTPAMNGEGQTHTFGAVNVGGPSAAAGSSFPLLPSVGGGVLALLAIAGLLLVVRRQRRTGPVPA
jgi:hypothetical protein